MPAVKYLPLLALLLASCLESADPDRSPVIVGSKSAPESVVMSEIAAQRLEARGCTVERRFSLGDTKALDGELEAGRIDAYVEEFSAAYTKVLGRDIDGQNAAAEPEARGRYVKRDLLWTPTLGVRDSAVVYRKKIDVKCRSASRALMSLGFITDESKLKVMVGQVRQGKSPSEVVKAAGVAK